MTTTLVTLAPPLSQSRQAKMACPHLYRQTEVLGIRLPQNAYAERGREIHHVISQYINHLVRTAQPTDYTRYAELLLGASAESLDVLEGLRDSLVIDPARVLGTELYIALDRDFESIVSYEATAIRPDRVAFEGTLDFVTMNGSAADIFDWKSFFQIVDADTFQSTLYPLLLFQHIPLLEVVTFHLEFVRYGASRSVEYTRADVPKLRKAVESERLRQLALHDIDPRGEAMPGAHCVYCPLLVNRECPCAAMNPYAEMTPEERVRFGVWLAQAKRHNDEVLKAFANHGPVEVLDGNGEIYAAEFTLQSKRTYPLIGTLPILTAWCANHTDDKVTAKLAISGLSPLVKAKKRAELREQLQTVAESRMQTKFRIGRADAEDEDEQ